MSSSAPRRARPRLELPLAFVSGVLFAVGLALAGMTQPGKVIGFLDVTGAWDPSLAFVMVGAIAVYFVATHLVKRRSAPLVGGGFHLPTRRDLEPSLLIGAGLFGIGWGIAGYCPGPGITSLGTGALPALTFVATMAVGMLLYEGAQRLRKARERTQSVASGSAA
jgi:uncharacterized membrane protein YedE/YeeE